MNKNDILHDDFKEACIDYCYLQEKNYPQKAAIKLIGDRYRLNTAQRSILLRGIVRKNIAAQRKMKLVREEDLGNNKLAIDTYNILITLCNYLQGKFTYIALDGLLRDSSEARGRLKSHEVTQQALTLLMRYLTTVTPVTSNFYLDSPISNSKQLANTIDDLLEHYKISGNTFVVKSPDYHLINSENTLCATSDSHIIDNKKSIADLAHLILNKYFKPDFIDLSHFIAS